MAEHRTVQGERRVVTILFCDVKGSTAMAEQLDPEEWAEIMNEAFRYLTAPIHRFGGTVARLMGDAILAFFGAPEAHEDDPQRAVLAGLAILEEIGPFCEGIRTEYGLDFNVRVGINTGTVVVGDIGTSRAMEYTAMGDAVNIASRMEESAEPGTVLIAQDTQKQVAPLFELEPLGRIEIQGKRDPIPTFKVVRAKDEPGTTRGIEGLSSPLVGRQVETELLQHALSNLMSGHGGIVNIIGEAGLGKSRLIDEMKKVWVKDFGEEHWNESKGVSFESNRPYSIFIESARTIFGIKPDDPPDITRDKIAACLADWPVEQKELAGRAVEILLAVQEGDLDIQQEAEALQREFTGAVRSAWKELAIQGPLLLVFDDLHWADPTSVNVLTHLFSLTDEVPILFLCAMRPYRGTPGWQIKSFSETEYPHRYTEIELEPLTEQDSDELIGNLLIVADLPIDLRQLILRKAEGNPFFVEEVIRTLIDEGAIVRTSDGYHWESKKQVEEISLPDNLQALLIARIDRLDAEIRRTLQLASVIGRSFFFRILERLDEATDQLNRHLTALQRVELIREAARFPELEYIFLHEMTRDAAYETILKRERRKYHRSVGEAIETLFPEQIENESPRLASHFLEAGEYRKAFEYFIMAGDHARRLYANKEAIQAYSKALSLIEKVEVDEDRLVYLYKRRGRSYELLNQYDEALENYKELGELGEKRGSKPLQLAALLPAATIHSTPTAMVNSKVGRALSDQALEYARELRDPQGEAEALWNLMLLEGMVNNNNREAIEFGELSLQIAREHNLREQLAFTLHDLSRRYLIQGNPKRAIASAEEARRLWMELDNKTMLGNNYTMTANVYHILGEFDKAIDLAHEGLQISQSIGSNWGQGFSYIFLAEVYLELGNFNAGMEAINQGLSKGRQAQFSSQYLGYTECLLAWTLGMLGDYEAGIRVATKAKKLLPFAAQAVLVNLYYHMNEHRTAEEILDEVIENFEEVRRFPIPTAFSSILIFFGQPAIYLGKLEIIQGLVGDALEYTRQSKIKLYYPDLLYLNALILVEERQIDEAAGMLRRAEEMADQIGSRRALLSILPVLVEVERELGNHGEAEDALERAIEVIEFIGDHAGSAELRQSFLETRKVKAVLS